jgi:PBSX family phage terminase large subunit
MADGLVSREEAESGRLFDNRPPVTQRILTDRSMWSLYWGPSGSGKTRTILEKCRSVALKYPRSRILFVRSVRKWLTQSVLVTWEQKVLVPGDVIPDRIQRSNRSEYRFPNGSVVVVAGLDDPQQVMSAEYDIIFINEATEIPLDTAETALNRIRNGRVPYQQVIMDCNPAGPTHWLKKAMDDGRLQGVEVRHRDNPALFDPDRQDWTAFGRHYVGQVLASMTGTRKTRLADGKWSAAEGVIYESWDESLHLIPAQPIPEHWRRFWSIDFGYTNPFSWSWYAEDEDGRLHMYREIYSPGLMVEDAVKMGLKAMNAWDEGTNAARWDAAHEPRPTEVICDHDAGDRATFERHAQVSTLPAEKAVAIGLQDVQSRLRLAGDGRPRLYLHRGCLIHEPSQALQKAGKPTCMAEEFPSYVWDTTKAAGEQPRKTDDHAMDQLRYMCRHLGTQAIGPAEFGADYSALEHPNIFG